MEHAKEAHSHNRCQAIKSPEKSPSVEIVTPDMSPMENLLRSGKSIVSPRWISLDYKIAASGLISSWWNMPRGDFQTGDIISWHLLNLAAYLPAIWTNGTICAWKRLHFANTNINLELYYLWKANEV